MKNIWMLTLANLRKNKGQAVSMMTVILLATTLLSIGLVVLTDIGRFFDERADYLNAPHFVAVEDRNATNDNRLGFIQEFPGVIETETQHIIAGLGGYYVDDVPSAGAILIANGSEYQEMNPLSLIGDYLPLVGDAIYIPHFMFLSGYELGDHFQLDFLGRTLDFTVAGSTEDITFGDLGPGNWRVHVSAERFSELGEQFPNNEFTLLSARMENIEDAAFLHADYNATFFGMEYAVQTLDAVPFPWTLESAREGRLFMPTLIATLLTAFSLIIFVVGIIVTRFRIVSSIEDGITNIGILKAMGYRNHQIISSIVLQFGLLAFVGSLLGLLLSFAILPAFEGIFEPLLGLIWTPAIDISMSVIAIIALILLVLLFSYLSARRIWKLHPLVALRGGLGAHNSKKNPIALNKARGPLVLLLAVKQLLQNKKQAFAISLIVVGLLVASVVGVASHYNMNVNTDAFLDLLGGDFADLVVIIDKEEGGQEAMMRLSGRSEVDMMYGGEFSMLFIDDVLITTTVIEDFSYLIGEALVEGRLPQYDNEIVLGIPALRVMDKGIGDWVTVRIGYTEQEYQITGSLQDINHGGFTGMISVESMLELQPDFTFTRFFIFLADGTDEVAFAEMISEAEGDALSSVIVMQDQLDVMIEGMGSVFALIAAVILIVMVAVIVLVLYMIIKTVIRRRRRELGIQKALGFTTLQLMNQISLSLMPMVIFGAIIGSIAGYFGFNPLYVILLSGLGVTEANMFVPIDWVFLVSLALILLAYSVSMLIAWRIRKISAYALVTE